MSFILLILPSPCSFERLITLLHPSVELSSPSSHISPLCMSVTAFSSSSFNIVAAHTISSSSGNMQKALKTPMGGIESGQRIEFPSGGVVHYEKCQDRELIMKHNKIPTLTPNEN